MAIETGIRELKANLSSYLRRVKAGETLIITEYGKPIGRITPITADADERLELLLQAGRAKWNRQTFPAYTPTIQTKGEATLSDLLIEDRE
ncbi:MAG: type II toxin-antitoxin system prevent-host-death family antitoxin [Ardenticatenaceae bacterium]|nr:type II toxin-antitoxin system prevent-host-death family antitoxin [Ardenticatenaceae bacterium]MCB8986291.1 type II toxin-antitoxin system prevent-host-death family antitoxin [Ardenticatenaceae bacterium]